MEKEFVPYDIALDMKELGFDEPCFGYFKYEDEFYLEGSYKNSEHGFSIARPLYQQAFRWFREVYDMAHEITYAGAKGRYNAFTDDWVYDSNGELKKFSYEEAELACLRKLIEIVNQNKDGIK